MPMSIATLEILEQAHMPSGYARAIAKAIEGDFTQRLDHLATREDLKAQISDLRVELKSDISDLRLELKSDISQLRVELKTDTAALRTEFKGDLGQVRNEIRDAKVESMRFTVRVAMAQLAMYSGIMYFLLHFTGAG